MNLLDTVCSTGRDHMIHSMGHDFDIECAALKNNLCYMNLSLIYVYISVNLNFLVRS